MTITCWQYFTIINYNNTPLWVVINTAHLVESELPPVTVELMRDSPLLVGRWLPRPDGGSGLRVCLGVPAHKEM